MCFAKWRRPGPAPRLAEEEIHLWRISLDLPADQMARLGGHLEAGEWARANGFRFEQHRRAFVAARGALREILGRYVRTDPDQIRFAYGPNGKPSLPASRIQFNFSNTTGLALCAVCYDHPIGLDVERNRPVSEALTIATHYFTARECQALRMVRPNQLTRAFFNGWTRKEAYLKATGDGLSCPLSSFEVTLDPSDEPRLVTIDGDPIKASRWRLFAFCPEEGCTAAMVVPSLEWSILCFDWPTHLGA